VPTLVLRMYVLLMYISHIRVPEYIAVHTYVHVSKKRERDYMYTYICIETCIHIHICTYKHTCKQYICRCVNLERSIDLYSNICPLVHLSIYGSIYVLIHLSMYIHTYVYICLFFRDAFQKELHSCRLPNISAGPWNHCHF